MFFFLQLIAKYYLESGLYAFELRSSIMCHCINVWSLQMNLDSLNFSVQALHRLIWDSNVLFIRDFLLLMVAWDILSLCPKEECEGVSSYRYCWYIFKFITIGVDYNIVSCVDNLALALLFYFEMKIYLFDHRRGVSRSLCFVWCIGKKVLVELKCVHLNIECETRKWAWMLY